MLSPALSHLHHYEQCTLSKQKAISLVFAYAVTPFVAAALLVRRCAVVRYGRQARSQVSLCALLPQMGSATVPDHFVMIGLPFSGNIFHS